MKPIILYLTIFCVVLMSTTNAADKNTSSIDHIGLSVSDLEASTNFFVDTLDFSVSGRDLKYPSVFMNNGEMSLTLWQTDDQPIAFNRKENVGLHHLAISVTSFEALDALYAELQDKSGVIVEFSPELANGGPAKHMMIREPSGNRIELVHRPNKE